MADILYNPLLKRNLQYLGDTAAIQAEIDALQSAVNTLQGNIDTLQTNLNALKGNKITKVTAAAQLPNIAVGEIFEWQAESQTVDGVDFVNGYFYKSNGATITVTPPVPYIAFTNDFPQNQPYQLGDYNFVFGNYYQVQYYDIDVSNIRSYSYVDTNHTYRFIAIKPINNSSNVGDVIFDRVLNIPETITAVDTVNHTATTDNGQTVKISSVSSSYMLKLWQIGNADGSQSFYMLEPNSHMYYLLVHWDFETNTIIDWFPFECLLYTSNTPYIFNTVAFSQTDTQPQQLSIVDNQVKYTLRDNTTQINLVSDDTISNTAVNFPTAAVLGNILTGDTLGTIAKKVFQKSRFLSCELPFLQYSDLPSQSTETETSCREWLQYIVQNYWNRLESEVLYVTPFRPNSSGFVVGYFYATDTPNAQHFPSYCSFLLLGISSSTLFNKFGTSNYTFYFKALTIL